MPSVVACQVDDGRDVGGLGDLDVGRERGGCVDVDAHAPIVAPRAVGDRRLPYTAPVEGARRESGRRHTLLWCQPSTSSSTPRSAGSAAPSGPVRSRWRTPSPTPSTARATCSCRPAPAPASRWPTSCPRCGTRWTRARPPSSPPPRWRCRPRSSTATCRGWPSRSPRCSAGARPTPWSRGGATTCAPTSSRVASPTTTPTP